jgi:hypothetical protein
VFRRYKIIAIQHGWGANCEVVNRCWTRNKAIKIAKQTDQYGYATGPIAVLPSNVRDVLVYDRRGFVIYSSQKALKNAANQR